MEKVFDGSSDLESIVADGQTPPAHQAQHQQ